MDGMILLLGLMMLPLFLVIIITPYLTRKTESFGVSIPENEYNMKQLIKMRKSYVMSMTIISVITIGIFLLIGLLFTHEENMLEIVFSIIIVVYLIISFIVYLIFHKKMKVLKSKADWTKDKSQLVVIDTTFRNQKLTYSHTWFLIPFVITLITTVLTLNNYDIMPNKIPMNYNLSGVVTNWAIKSYKTVLIMPLMQVYLIAIFLIINIVIAKAKQQVSSENPKDSLNRNIIFRRRWSAFLIISSFASTLLLSLMQLSLIYPINDKALMIASLIFTIGILIGAIFLAITTGQGGSRLKTKVTRDGEVIDRDDDRHWKLGMFYFNRDDPSIFLEKRFGVGWTNNWAHPLSWLFIIGIIVIGVGLPLILM